VTDVAKDARAAAQPPDLVEIARNDLDSGRLSIRGFVVAAGAEFLLLHRLSDRLDLDGYSAVRIRDITGLERDFPRKPFYIKALATKGIRPVVPEGIVLSDAHQLLSSVQERYPLIVIEQERLQPEECVIGRIKLTSENTYALRVISPSATWEVDDRTYRYSEVTRVGFDGEYERTLALVATHDG
jgi:hypothetical protein